MKLNWLRNTFKEEGSAARLSVSIAAAHQHQSRHALLLQWSSAEVAWQSLRCRRMWQSAVGVIVVVGIHHYGSH